MQRGIEIDHDTLSHHTDLQVENGHMTHLQPTWPSQMTGHTLAMPKVMAVDYRANYFMDKGENCSKKWNKYIHNIVNNRYKQNSEEVTAPDLLGSSINCTMCDTEVNL